MSTPFLAAMSRLTGWLADRRIPRPLRSGVYRTYARFTGADVNEASSPLDGYPSLGAFFVRRLVEGARTIEADPGLLPSPCDGTVQDLSVITEGSVLQAKGSSYPIRDLLAGVGEDLDLEGGRSWTIYLSPRDYHRVHTPEAAKLTDVRWLPGNFYSVRPSLLLRKPRVLCDNERAVLRLETERGPLLLVMVGALNVARIRVVGVEPGEDGPPSIRGGVNLERGDELARFEMGSTIVLVAPAGGPTHLDGLAQGDSVRLGQPIGTQA